MNDNKITGSFIIGYDISKDKDDQSVLIIGVQKPKRNVEIINAFTGQAAIDMYEMLKNRHYNVEADKK